MYLGIEIGGTKLQFGIGSGRGGDFADFRRLSVDPKKGARGIMDQIAVEGSEMCKLHSIEGVGIGFGGPVNSETGRTTKSHQVSGWEDVPLGAWCSDQFQRPTFVGNDCDVAAVAEATCGAGRGIRLVLYVTVGTGVGGGLVFNGQLHGVGRPAVCEIGHLRPSLEAVSSDRTVESYVSGLGIVETARRLGLVVNDHEVTGQTIADGARNGVTACREAINLACRTLGWAIAQTITLVAPEVIIVGGGVSLMGEELFLNPVRRYVAEYVFPPLNRSYNIVPSQLGESVVVHGALVLAASKMDHKHISDAE